MKFKKPLFWNSKNIISILLYPLSLIVLIINELKELKSKKKNKSELSTMVAEYLANKAKEKNITKVYFDRGVYKYHGRVKLLAEQLRKNGMEF